MTQDEQALAFESLRLGPEEEPTRAERWLPWIVGILAIVIILFGLGLGAVLLNVRHVSATTQAIIKADKAHNQSELEQASKSSAAGLVILHDFEASLAKQFATIHNSGLLTREILCTAAQEQHPSNTAIVKLCTSAPPG